MWSFAFEGLHQSRPNLEPINAFHHPDSVDVHSCRSYESVRVFERTRLACSTSVFPQYGDTDAHVLSMHHGVQWSSKYSATPVTIRSSEHSDGSIAYPPNGRVRMSPSAYIRRRTWC